MFKEIISHKGFWRSVISLAIAFVLLFVLVKWAIEGFKMEFFTIQDPWLLILGSCVAGLVYGFFVTYGKFRARLKKKNQK